MSEEETNLFLLLSESLIDQVINDDKLPDSLKCQQIQLITSSAVYQARSCGHTGDESQLNDDLDTKIRHFFEFTSTKWIKTTRNLNEDAVLPEPVAVPKETLDSKISAPEKEQTNIEPEDTEDTLAEVIMAPENVSFFLRVVRVVGDLLLNLVTALTKNKKKKKKKKKKDQEPKADSTNL